MVVKFDLQTKKVLFVNEYQSKEEAESRLNENTIWIEGSLPTTESRDGYTAVFYVNDDLSSIRVEYEPVTEPEPSQLDRMEAQLNKSQDELRQEGADMMMSELAKRGLMV